MKPPKPNPRDVAQICRNGHLIVGSLNRYPQFGKSFCVDCGAATTSECQSCHWPIEGISDTAWMADSGPYRPPKYCGECGTPFPWTEVALSAARAYTDDLDQLNAEEKVELKETFTELTSDTPRTPVAANRFKKLIGKIGAPAGDALKNIIVTVATEAAKKSMGL